VADSGSGIVTQAGLGSADHAATDRSRDLIGLLSRRRAESGLSQAQVARLMQTSQSAVARLESGQRDVQLSTVARYAGALGLTLDLTEDTVSPAGAFAGPRHRDPPPSPAAAPPGREPDGVVPVAITEQPDPGHALTPRQRKVLRVIRESVQQRGYPPSMREIGEAVGLASTSSVSHQLAMLQRKGYLRRDVGRPRSGEVRPPGRPAARSVPEEPAAGLPGTGAPPQDTAFVPVLGRIAGGRPAPPGEPVLDVMPLPRQLVGEGSLFAVKVTGDSMINAAITDGDLAVIRPGSQPDDGDIVVADIDGVPTVRTLKRTQGHVWLLPHHPSYAPTYGDKIKIFGPVVSVLRKL